MVVSNFLKATIFCGFALFSNIVESATTRELHAKALKLFNLLEIPGLSPEIKAKLSDPADSTWQEFLLQEFQIVCFEPFRKQFLNIATTLRDQLVDIDKPFVDTRSWATAFTDVGRSAAGYETYYQEEMVKYELRQKKLIEFNFETEKNKFVEMVREMDNFMLKLFTCRELSKKFIQSLAIAFINAMSAICGINYQSSEINISIIPTARQLIFQELCDELKRPFFIAMSQINAKLKAVFGLDFLAQRTADLTKIIRGITVDETVDENVFTCIDKDGASTDATIAPARPARIAPVSTATEGALDQAT